jgi:protein-S-isoprenylcysteine O-methyltransferase Ste14
MKITRQTIKEMRIFRKVSGVLLIIIGLAGIILPILPGWVLIFVGLSLLGINIWFVELAKEYAIRQSKKARDKTRKSIRKRKEEE